MPEDVTPEPRSLRAVGPEDSPRERFAQDFKREADRQAAAILAEHQPLDPQLAHAVVALAWSQGYLAGADRMRERLFDEWRKIGGAS